MEFIPSTTIYLITLLSFSMPFATSATIFDFENCEFPAIFNFGDSNSDTGGLAASFTPPNFPNGETYFDMPAGRYCDGRLIIDFISKSLDLPYLSAYLNSLGTNFTHGANFATSSSTITLPTSIMPNGEYSPFYLGVQYEQFLRFKARSQLIREGGGIFARLMPREEYFEKALYTFDIGQNDLGAGFFSMSVEEVNASVPDMINAFSTNVENIYHLGARSFWIHNTGPIGCLGYILVGFPTAEKDVAGCAKPYNEVAQYFNHKLKESVFQLRRDFSTALFTYVDVYSLKYALFSEPKTYGILNLKLHSNRVENYSSINLAGYDHFLLFIQHIIFVTFGLPDVFDVVSLQTAGFELPLVACCGYGNLYNYSSGAVCGATIAINGTQKTVGSCDTPSVRVVWDGEHYTEAANKFIFDQISTGVFSDPPVPLKMACHRTADLQRY